MDYLSSTAANPEIQPSNRISAPDITITTTEEDKKGAPIVLGSTNEIWMQNASAGGLRGSPVDAEEDAKVVAKLPSDDHSDDVTSIPSIFPQKLTKATSMASLDGKVTSRNMTLRAVGFSDAGSTTHDSDHELTAHWQQFSLGSDFDIHRSVRHHMNRGSTLHTVRRNQYRQFRATSEASNVVRPCESTDPNNLLQAVVEVEFLPQAGGRRTDISHFRVARSADLDTVLTALCTTRSLDPDDHTISISGAGTIELDRNLQYYLDLHKCTRFSVVQGPKAYSTKIVCEDGRDVMIIRDVEGKELVMAATIDKLIEQITPEDESKA
ncbi:hypothetical protein HDU93_004042, partial [Gonapodya sp. JEL0774]